MGLSVNDGNVIRPATEPMTAELTLDWNANLAEALVHRPELRSQKWNIKSLELQHSAAEKLVRPRLDFVASYGVNAFGDQLTGDGPNYQSAYATLLANKHTNWGLGFEFSMPFGFRGAITQSIASQKREPSSPNRNCRSVTNWRLRFSRSIRPTRQQRQTSIVVALPSGEFRPSRRNSKFKEQPSTWSCGLRSASPPPRPLTTQAL